MQPVKVGSEDIVFWLIPRYYFILILMLGLHQVKELFNEIIIKICCNIFKGVDTYDIDLKIFY